MRATSLENVLTITVVWVSVLFLLSWSFIVTFWSSTFKFRHKYCILQSLRMFSSFIFVDACCSCVISMTCIGNCIFSWGKNSRKRSVLL